LAFTLDAQFDISAEAFGYAYFAIGRTAPRCSHAPIHIARLSRAWLMQGQFSESF